MRDIEFRDKTPDGVAVVVMQSLGALRRCPPGERYVLEVDGGRTVHLVLLDVRKEGLTSASLVGAELDQ